MSTRKRLTPKKVAPPSGSLPERLQRLQTTLADLPRVEPPCAPAVMQLPYAVWRELQQVLAIVALPAVTLALSTAREKLLNYQPPNGSDPKEWRLHLIDGWIRTHAADSKVAPWQTCELAGLRLLRAMIEEAP